MPDPEAGRKDEIMIFTTEHDALRHTVRRFVEDEVNPNVEDWEREGCFPAHELFGKAARLGLLGITRDEAYGGLGLDYSFQAVLAEEMGCAHHLTASLAIGVQTMMATPALAAHGSEELKQAFLAPAIAGEMVASIAVSEPHAGSDVAALTTTARKDGGDYVISGTKMWITHATQADYLCLLANTGEGPVHKNKSLIVVPTATPGVTFSERLEKLGLRASDTAQVFLDEVRVPQRFRIGEEGQGFIYQMQQFQEERLWLALSSLKALEACIDNTVDYCRDRPLFGASLLSQQVVQYNLAEMQSEIELLRALCYRAVEELIDGTDVTRLATIAKYKAGVLGRTIPDRCLQYWGGMGYMWNNPVSRAFRELRGLSVGGGSNETMLSVLSRQMGLA